MKNILVTGGCGFIGSHFVNYIYCNTNWNITIIDKLSYSSKGLERLRELNLLQTPRICVFTWNLESEIENALIKEIGQIDYIVHMASETHVDNSIKNPVSCIRNNVMSTVNILEYARKTSIEKFFYFSTDEVYGSAPNKISYNEEQKHNSSNPYSASKSAGEQICLSYKNTYNVPVIILNSMNVFGERQHVEKFIPKCIKYILANKTIPIHSDETCDNSGSRFYIYVDDVSNAIMFVILHGKIGETYHITGEKEITNLELSEKIARILNKNLRYKMVNYHASRPGHDLRYALNGDKLISLGWIRDANFEESLENLFKVSVKS